MEKIKIKNLIKQVRGVSYKPEDLHSELDDDSVILLRANNIDSGKINLDDVVYVDKSKVSAEQYLRKGDILICASSGSKSLVGKAACVDFDRKYTFGAFCKVVRPNEDIIDYLGVFFQSPVYRRKISEVAIGVNINNIRNEHIDELVVPLYSKNEQRDIVKKILLAQEIISKRKSELSVLDDLIKARFVEMFGDPKSNSFGFDKMMLKDTCKVVTGNTPSRSVAEYYGDYIEWIKTDNIVPGLFNPTKATESLSKKGMEIGRIVDRNSILMACIAGSIASIGRVCITDRMVAFNQQINAIIPKRYNILFLYVLLQISKDYLVEEINMALKGILSKSKLEKKEFIVPPMEMQNQFAEFVEQINKSKVSIQKALDETKLLFDSLMQKYFG